MPRIKEASIQGVLFPDMSTRSLGTSTGMLLAGVLAAENCIP